jgi:hypothetical protein
VIADVSQEIYPVPSAFSFEHDSGIRISRALTIAEVERVAGVRRADMTTGYIWYYLPETKTGSTRILVSLCFCRDQLDSVSFAASNPELYGSNWSEWTEPKEQMRARDTEAFLRHLGFPQGEYDWGDVWAGYDSKGGSGHATIKYKNG